MSMQVNNIYVKTNCVGEPEVIIGDKYFSMVDFCRVVEYVLTNTDLKSLEDPRIELRNVVASMRAIKGFNEGAFRLESCDADAI